MAQQSDSAIEHQNKFKLTATELEELNHLRLTTGCSESVVEEKQEEVKTYYKPRPKRGKPPPPPTNRDAMGNYIVPKGEESLAKGIDLPGPTSYDPQFNFVQSSAPVYSLGERVFNKAKRGTPGPNKYNLAGDLLWKKCKSITIKVPQTIKQTSTGPGPGKYRIPTTIGTGPKYSLKKRSATAKIQGFVSALAAEPDPEVPGPQYDVTADCYKPVTFGSKPKDRKPAKTPGPNKYKLGSELKGPNWSVGIPLATAEPSYRGNPAPNKYTLKTLMGTGPKAVVTKDRRIPKIPTGVPGPDIYHRAGFDLSEPGYTMKYRWFDEKRPKMPGPSSYNPEEVKKKSPGYSFQSKTKPTYPSSVYAQLTVNTPAPDAYDVPTQISTSGGKTFGTARTDVADGLPGPANYLRTSFPLPTAPSYSLGQKPVEKKLSGARHPGPANYSLKIPPTKYCTIAKKIYKSQCSVGPGPAAYDLPPGGKPVCELEHGVTIKSRHTPLKYNGLKTQGRLSLLPPDMRQAPIVG